MSLDDIQLGTALIAGLYKKTLLNIDINQPSKQDAANSILATLGNNGQRISILVQEPGFRFLSDADMDFLTGILAACNLNMNDVALLNMANEPAAGYELINAELKPSVLLFFGVAPASTGLPLNFPPYQLQKYNNQTFLAAPSLQELAQNKEEKRNLWLCLKTLFHV